MTYIDPASSIRVEQMFAMTNAPQGTYAPSYSAPTFTRSFDARSYMRAMIVVPVEVVGAGITLDLKLQKASSPDFATFTDIAGAAFTQIAPANDNQAYTATIDLSKHQNAIGIHATVTGATNRARWGVYAILFPYDTSNSGFGTNITNEFDI
jgi:hypothetical protein